MMSSQSIVWTIFALCLSATGVQACPVCIEKPKATLADRLLDAEAIVIARAHPEAPYRFAEVARWKGDEVRDPIPYLLDSGTRRRLAARTDDGILLFHDGEAWTRSAYLDAAMRRTVRDILAQGPRWRNDRIARFAFFEKLLNHPDSGLRGLAVDEMSRLPYGLVRRMRQPVDGPAAREALLDRNKAPWAGFYILMLGLSERPEDHELIRARTSMAANVSGISNLEAWATAAVEVDGASGISRLMGEWVERHSLSIADLRALVSALSVHGREGDPSLRPAIRDALGKLLLKRPELTGSIAFALAQIGDLTRSAVVEKAIEASTQGQLSIDPAELFMATSYVRQAENAVGGEGASVNRGNRKCISDQFFRWPRLVC
jgi:hypothetical protein